MVQDWLIGFMGLWLMLLAAFNVGSPTLLFLSGAMVGILGFWGTVRGRFGNNRGYIYRHPDFGIYMD
jgi:hypothetical protein